MMRAPWVCLIFISVGHGFIDIAGIKFLGKSKKGVDLYTLSALEVTIDKPVILQRPTVLMGGSDLVKRLRESFFKAHAKLTFGCYACILNSCMPCDVSQFEAILSDIEKQAGDTRPKLRFSGNGCIWVSDDAFLRLGNVSMPDIPINQDLWYGGSILSANNKEL